MDSKCWLVFYVYLIFFQPPQPMPKWDGVREAFKEGNRAPHFDMVTKEFCGNEDCLFLNVYTPEVINCAVIFLLKILISWGN